jgi:hypothetical protein
MIGPGLKQTKAIKGVSIMMTKRIPLTLAATLVATALGLSATFAQSSQSVTPNAPAQHQAPMSDQGMAGGGDMMKMMGQMNRMMENCNRMMETMQHAPSAPDKTPPHNG